MADIPNREDAYEYFMYHFEKGIEPEDQLAYEIGGAEAQFREMQESNLEKITQEQSLRQFLWDARRIPSPNLTKNTIYKRSVLIKYFPERFGPKGIQKINEYDAVKVGALFNKVVGYYQKKLTELEQQKPKK